MNLGKDIDRRNVLRAMAAGLAAASTWPAWGQAYPSQPIRLVVPAGAGGGGDTFARLVSMHAAQKLGQSVVVENLPGAGGVVGADRVAKAAKDGYTVLWGLNPIFTMIPALRRLPFAETDLQPVCRLISNAYVWVARNEFPANDMQQVIALAKASPRKVSYASTGPGSAAHLGGALFEQLAKVDMLHVPFRATGIPEVMGGHVDLKMEPLGSATPLILGGKLKALGVTSKDVLPALPQVRPVADVLPDYQVEGWHGLWLPAGAPQAVADALRTAFVGAVQAGEVRSRIQDTGSKVAALDQAQTAALIQRELGQWKELITARNIKDE